MSEVYENLWTEVKKTPELPDEETRKLRLELIAEELEELWDAIEDKDLVMIADALTDILYVTYGAGHAFGIDLDECFERCRDLICLSWVRMANLSIEKMVRC